MDGKQLQQLGILRDLCDSWVLVDSVEEIVLLVVVRGKNDEVDDSLQDLSTHVSPRMIIMWCVREAYGLQLGGVLLYRLGIQHLTVVLADVEVS